MIKDPYGDGYVWIADVAITDAGIVASIRRYLRISGSAASAIVPFGSRRYLGGSSDRSAARTVFLATPVFRAIALIPRPSDRRSRRISAHSSKVITHPFCHAR